MRKFSLTNHYPNGSTHSSFWGSVVYSKVGAVSVLKIFNLPVYRRVGDIINFMGIRWTK